jgi:hypothetical protein
MAGRSGVLAIIRERIPLSSIGTITFRFWRKLVAGVGEPEAEQEDAGHIREDVIEGRNKTPQPG